ncbi:MAG: hypothetical protein ABFD58_10135, partial [Anaerolineaceae bacterium]
MKLTVEKNKKGSDIAFTHSRTIQARTFQVIFPHNLKHFGFWPEILSYFQQFRSDHHHTHTVIH